MRQTMSVKFIWFHSTSELHDDVDKLERVLQQIFVVDVVLFLQGNWHV